mmetsp:Transcript_43078/g.100548  ORF Transcript_43078/g.100548 Transcript_43078/m.100548 type:complete len:201 (+) Transcript_43078:124-726(+)
MNKLHHRHRIFPALFLSIWCLFFWLAVTVGRHHLKLQLLLLLLRLFAVAGFLLLLLPLLPLLGQQSLLGRLGLRALRGLGQSSPADDLSLEHSRDPAGLFLVCRRPIENPNLAVDCPPVLKHELAPIIKQHLCGSLMGSNTTLAHQLQERQQLNALLADDGLHRIDVHDILHFVVVPFVFVFFFAASDVLRRARAHILVV